MNAGVQVKLWDPLRTRAIPERLRGVFTTRRYTNTRLPLPYLYPEVPSILCSATSEVMRRQLRYVTKRFSYWLPHLQSFTVFVIGTCLSIVFVSIVYCSLPSHPLTIRQGRVFRNISWQTLTRSLSWNNIVVNLSCSSFYIMYLGEICHLNLPLTQVHVLPEITKNSLTILFG